MLILYVFCLILSVSLIMIVARSWRARHLDRWLFSYLRQAMSATGRRPGSPVHLILCIADHFEPGNGRAPAEQASGRVEQWIENYPRLFKQFRDSDGQPPRHTFFYPLERYLPAEVDALADLCRQGYGEVEVHLHHDNDHAEALRERLNSYKETLALKHGLLARDRETRELKYGFIHGNWALDNSHPDGRNCGVNNELDILRETGCYADFTMPSASDPTQTRTINSIYYAVDDPAKPKSHDRGVPVGVGTVPSNGLMLIQGPLVLDWGRRRWGSFQESRTVAFSRINQQESIDCRLGSTHRVQVSGRPDWYFVKLHTHGAPEWNQKVAPGRANGPIPSRPGPPCPERSELPFSLCHRS